MMAKIAHVTLGRDAKDVDEANSTLLKLSHAFEANLKTILSEEDSKNIRPLALAPIQQGLSCYVGASIEILANPSKDSNEAWDDALEKLADVFTGFGASVVVNDKYAEFVFPVNSIKTALLDKLEIRPA